MENANCKLQIAKSKMCVMCDVLAGLLWFLLRGFLVLVRSCGQDGLADDIAKLHFAFCTLHFALAPQ